MRPDWDTFFLRIAQVVATRSTCNRKQVGAVIVNSRNHMLSSGYGGSIRGQPHCIDVGCDIDAATGGCRRTVHAETNALAQAASNGVSVEGATIYTTLSPCYACFKMLANSGITRIVFAEQYRISLAETEIKECGITLVHLPLRIEAAPTEIEALTASILKQGREFAYKMCMRSTENSELCLKIDKAICNLQVPNKHETECDDDGKGRMFTVHVDVARLLNKNDRRAHAVAFEIDSILTDPNGNKIGTYVFAKSAQSEVANG